MNYSDNDFNDLLLNWDLLSVSERKTLDDLIEKNETESLSKSEIEFIQRLQARVRKSN